MTTSSDLGAGAGRTASAKASSGSASDLPPPSERGEIEPCPFCGGEAYFARLSGRHGGVKCRACNAGTDLFDSKPCAIAAWNRREALLSAEAGERDEWKERALERGVVGANWMDRAQSAEAEVQRLTREVAKLRRIMSTPTGAA